MRVLIDYRAALRERSGAGEYTHQVVKALLSVYRSACGSGEREPASETLDVTLFSSSWKDRIDRSALAQDLGPVSVVDSHVPGKLLNLAWHRLEWPPAEVLARGCFDVTHSSHPLLMPSRAARVVTIHDLDFLSHPERTSAEIRRDYPALTPSHARRADCILVPSRFTASEVERRLNISRERIAVCPPGAPDWTPREEPAAATSGYILFVGTLEPRKNIPGLLDAYQALIRSRTPQECPDLVIAGRPTAASGSWLERIERPPLAGKVRHLGYIETTARRELFAGARLLVLPSFEEGFGLPVLEAMTVGVPVVASTRGSLPELVGDAGPLVDPDDSAGIAAAIARLLDDGDLAHECIGRGCARARDFQWSRTARAVYAAYASAIENAHAHAAVASPGQNR